MAWKQTVDRVLQADSLTCRKQTGHQRIRVQKLNKVEFDITINTEDVNVFTDSFQCDTNQTLRTLAAGLKGVTLCPTAGSGS